jgi:hypothetical protein
MSDCCPSCGYPESKWDSCNYCEAYPEVRGPIDSIEEMARRVLFLAKPRRHEISYHTHLKQDVNVKGIEATFDEIIRVCQLQIQKGKNNAK